MMMLSENKQDDKRQGKERDLEAYLYTSDKARLSNLVQKMAKLAGSALHKSVSALDLRNLKSAQEVIDGDDVIDEMDEQIDQECLYSIATRQPVRKDLRFVYAMMKITTDLERVGDQAVNVAMQLKKITDACGPNALCPHMKEIKDIEERSQGMLNDVMVALTAENGDILMNIKPRRREIHEIENIAVEDLVACVINSQPAIACPLVPSENCTNALFAAMWVLRHLGRVADHIINLAEKVYFIATGVSSLTLKHDNAVETKK